MPVQQTLFLHNIYVKVSKSLALFLLIILGLVRLLPTDAALGDSNATVPLRNGKENMALGKPCRLEPPPNYIHCKDTANDHKLTDGIRHEGPSFWTQKTTVGWDRVPHVLITIDLGKVEPIGGVAFHTAFDGPINVEWPKSIKVFVSDDGKDFTLVRELVDPMWEDHFPAQLGSPFCEQKQVYYDYATNLSAKGRYVCFAARNIPYVFCDEIEIYRGPPELLQETSFGPKTMELNKFLEKSLLPENIAAVLLHDIRKILGNSVSLATENRRIIQDELSSLRRKALALDFECTKAASRALTPLNELHQNILRVNATVLKSRNFPPVMLWHQHRWDSLEATEAPQTARTAPVLLKLEMMDRECRSEVLNVTNTMDAEVELQLSFTGLPGGSLPEYIQICQVEFVGTQRGLMIADPLTVLPKGEKECAVIVPAGMTRQIWLMFKPQGIKPGLYLGSLLVRPKGLPALTASLAFHLFPFKFPNAPRLSLAMYDYTDKPYACKGATDLNVPLAIQNLRTHGVDTPYAQRSSACLPDKTNFDQEGNLIKPLHFDRFDRWVISWKDSRRYFIYLGNNLEKFCGEPHGTPRFCRMVAQWAGAFSEHAREIGLRPEQIAFHLFDEPSDAKAYRINLDWGKAIKAGAPDIQLFINPFGFEKPSTPLNEMVAIHDIICPHLPQYGGITKQVLDVARSAPCSAKRFWFYSCLEPARLLDPYYYHLRQAWYCWRDGAEGMAFWNYWNYYAGEAFTAWNELGCYQDTAGVVYATKDSIVSGKHWEAIREGIEDYEYFNLLSKAVQKQENRGTSSAVARKGAALLEKLPSEVAGRYDRNAVLWAVRKDRSAADRVRLQVLECLAELQDAELRAPPQSVGAEGAK
ncbi:MAG: hypothetical protein PHV34_09115 [Verrucomicrobiae bacterium]|nr:hypothetical protein [Verrucomicrobiae bacterium]